MEVPFFSIITPSFNSESTIGRTIKSVLDQTFKEFEIIIIDDGSTDKTQEVVFTFNDKRILYQKIQNSGGPAKPRNLGIKLARGSWICFLDSDDFWNEKKLEFTFNKIKGNNTIDIWTTGYFVFNDNGIILERSPSVLVNKFSFKSLMIYSNPFITSALSINGNKVKSLLFDESKKMASVEDLDFLLNLAIMGLKADKIDEKLVYYYHNVNGISKNSDKHLKSLKFLFEKKINDTHPKNHFFFMKARVLSNYFWIKSTIKFQEENYFIFTLYLSLSFLLSPIDRIVYLIKFYNK